MVIVMFSHFTLGSNDLQRSEKFYDKLMPTLQQKRLHADYVAGLLMYGPENSRFPHLFLAKPFDNLPATWSNGFHIAFNASSTASVDQFYAAAMRLGGIDEGKPGRRPHYANDYYAAYVRDPDGNKLQAVFYLDGRKQAPTGQWISHITIGHHALADATKFYTAIFKPLGIIAVEQASDYESTGYGIDGYDLPIVYLQPSFDGRAATWGNGTHTAFTAPNREAVHQFHAAAIANGGCNDGAPGLRPHYSKNYYAAYARDPIGNKLQAVCRGLE